MEMLRTLLHFAVCDLSDSDGRDVSWIRELDFLLQVANKPCSGVPQDLLAGASWAEDGDVMSVINVSCFVFISSGS